MPKRSFRESLILYSGWITAFLVGFLDVPAKVNSFASEIRGALSHFSPRWDLKRHAGRWTNDPEHAPGKNVISETEEGWPDHGQLQFDLEWQPDGQLQGEVVAKTLRTLPIQSSRMFVDCEPLWLGGVQCAMWDVIMGDKRGFAWFKLTATDDLRGAPTLRFENLGQYAARMPAEALLWPTNAPLEDVGLNPAYVEMLMNVSKRAIDDRKLRDANGTQPPIGSTPVAE